jgi:B9 domain-containing protein 1
VPGCSNAYCKYQFVHGEDWQLLDGMEEGITQLARVGSGRAAVTACGGRTRGLTAPAAAGIERMMVWNFPLDVTYKTTNAFGWPQVVVSVYGLDAFGRDVIKGYGSIHLPTCAGRCAGILAHLKGLCQPVHFLILNLSNVTPLPG